MLKKILYVIVAILLGFIVFYLSWRSSYAKAVVNRGNKALEEENYEFFCKFLDYYEKDPASLVNYTENNNTTTIRTYSVFAKGLKDEDGNKVNRSGYMLLIYNINTDIITLDEEQVDDDVADDVLATRLTLTADNGATYTHVISTYGYDETPIVLYSLSTTETINKLNGATSITHIKITDCSEEKVAMLDSEVNLPLTEHNDEEYWTNLVNEDKAGVKFSQKEYNKNFSFAFPEMNKTLLITGITILILIGLGVFIFWPKKSFVPNEDEDREKYTFATTEEKNKYALAKIARDKREKEERENRYKNVRAEKSLDEITDEALKDSANQENTFEKAIEEDKALEESAKEENVDNTEETKEEN